MTQPHGTTVSLTVDEARLIEAMLADYTRSLMLRRDALSAGMWIKNDVGDAIDENVLAAVEACADAIDDVQDTRELLLDRLEVATCWVNYKKA